MSTRKSARPVVAAKPRLFIGSSAEAAGLAGALAKALSHRFAPEPWTSLGVFPASKRPADALLAVLGRADYGAFLFTPDDVVFSRGARTAAVRDNVLVELGMAIGRLGVDRSYVVMPRGTRLKLPSDLSGVEPIRYDPDQLDEDEGVAIGLVATDIATAAAAASPLVHPATSAIAELATKMTTILGGLATWRASFQVTPPPAEQFSWWAESVLSAADDACRRVLPSIPPDAYVAWLMPNKKKPDRGKLSVFYSHNLPAGYHNVPFARGEGVAGTAWDNGDPIIHTRDIPSPAWKPRKGCENSTYMCVPVGQKGGPGGVLAVGSDAGFRPTSDMHAVLRMFAEVLAVATG
jgi:predicted nucleotide-binding protein